MNEMSPGLDAGRRARLALKGERLYLKYCGRNGRDICAESFAKYQLTIGNLGVVVDYIAFLEGRLAGFSTDDSDPRKAMTADLLARIRRHIEQEGA